MLLELKVTNDKGEVEVFLSGSPQTPLQWKAPPGHPLVVERAEGNGCYKVWVLTVTPTAVLEMQQKRVETTKPLVF